VAEAQSGEQWEDAWIITNPLLSQIPAGYAQVDRVVAHAHRYVSGSLEQNGELREARYGGLEAARIGFAYWKIGRL